MGMIVKTTDYKKIAKQKQLAFEIEDLQAQRLSLLANLHDLGVKLELTGQSADNLADVSTLEQELKLLARIKASTKAAFLEQQVTDVLLQAKEGSHYIRLKRQFEKNPQLVKRDNLATLHDEQTHYQHKQLEIFDYLHKHFAQFEAADFNANLPDVGKKFFAQIVAVIKAEIADLTTQSRSIFANSQQQNRKLQKLRRQLQRSLEHIQAEIDKNLSSGLTKTSQLINKKNKDCRRLKNEIANLEALRASSLNQINILLDLGISQLKLLGQKLKTIIDQNQITRGLLYELKDGNKQWRTALLQEKITQMFADFDTQVANTINLALTKQYDEEIVSTKARESFAQLVEEVLQFQEYLGQVMMDSYTVLSGSIDDLERARFEYGVLVLDFYGDN